MRLITFWNFQHDLLPPIFFYYRHFHPRLAGRGAENLVGYIVIPFQVDGLLPITIPHRGHAEASRLGQDMRTRRGSGWDRDADPRVGHNPGE